MKHTDDFLTIDLIMLSKFGKNDGGGETWVYNFYPELLRNRNIKLNIFGYRTSNNEDNTLPLKLLDDSGLNKITPIILSGKNTKYPMFLSMSFKLKQTLKNFYTPKPDFTIAIGIFELMMMLLNRRFKNTTRIVWLRSIFLHEKASKIPWFTLGLFKYIIVLMLKKVDVIIANGDDIKYYYENLGLDVKVIKNSIDSKKWAMKPPKVSEKLKVAYIGRLSKIKGIESFFDAIKAIKESLHHNKFEFHIAGDVNDYLTDIQTFEDNDWIKYHGNINNDVLPDFLKKIDICVALTYASPNGGGGGTSNALMEQMAASKIIIAWDNLIFKQLLNDKNAYLVEQYSVDGIVNSLLDIYKNQKHAIDRGLQAKDTIQPYTVESQVKKFLEILKTNSCKINAR